MLRVRRLSATAVIAVIVGAGLTACGGDRWCEHDATDTRVADSFCERNTPGYEWESGSDHKKSKKKKSTKKASKSRAKH
ncbi:hypothetical protein [Actinomadura sp. HBU206391]|uniref:hypothetical protein n=1 Tax=Actinomadura sp. HBU206391 TaxID=2731692 RepID=UPI00164F0012|nr:hypothetical protein [Actinomadura sp. HBU206391]MBC6456403.1 hypothetical protein [Actinomadura sp. HBU206391]